jgi:hypothetical protein
LTRHPGHRGGPIRGQASLDWSVELVGRGGFEPPISWSQTRRSAGLSHRPPDCAALRACG